jgi:hypothetical protein
LKPKEEIIESFEKRGMMVLRSYSNKNEKEVNLNE